MNKYVLPAAIVGGIVFTATGQSVFAATGQDIVNKASQFQGRPYVYGAPAFSTSSFDCSSFTQLIYKLAAGVTLPRVAADQATKGIAVSKYSLQAGDLLFFDTAGDGSIQHVGIYTGKGQMISAQTSYGVHITNVFSGGGSEGYWAPKFVTARRIIGTAAARPAAAATQSESVSSQSSSSVYTVKSGDSLWAIGQSHGLSVSTLKSLNGLSSDLIHPGQTLKLSSSASAAASSSSSSGQTSSSSSVYTVKSGDSLWAIGQSHGLSASALKSLNGLSSNLIYPGQQLKVTSSSTASSSSASSGGGYQVKAGDNLWEIATLHGVTVNRLMRANNLSLTLIFPGQHLIIP
ncbi:LysM peptidoglycan-binding domain-containing protein [Sporolactobacillus sp. CQH2019]|uniref:LysM peptidoglycan-binding domain-containing protein n=1 Tax=Sporolactobacillus sp. CQH2019 TaxID=3023512 RepID=UPI002367DEA0|nr:LysM peptidoglycan-binding domain-containing protein [Sporolactobacillus sp. CQH2019]MDD9148366.1 LysM peptidoglycan-binding domain-containing protein [Sporolactobacillus sp. CQH2019]